jgi:hypothetical protein
MTWRVCFVAAVAALVSCFIKPDPPSAGTDARGDAPMMPSSDAIAGTDGGEVGCAVHSVTEHFPGMTLNNCGSNWADSSGSPIGTSGGPLMIGTVSASVGSCTSHTLGAGGAITVVGVPSTPNDVIFLHATTTQTNQITAMRVVIAASSRTIELIGANGTVSMSYDPSTMRWWRLSADTATSLIAEYSATGTTWTTLGTASTAPDPATSVKMSFGVSSTAQGSGSFDDYVQCQ